MSRSETEIRSHLDRWQGILRLRDWDIKLEFGPERWRKSGDIKVDLENRKAILLINEVPRSENLEELVVHELVHLKLYALDQMLVYLLEALCGDDISDPRHHFAHTQFMITLESTTEDLTKALLAAAGSKDELSFGRLRGEIEAEVGRR
jgi:hypothetical protein